MNDGSNNDSGTPVSDSLSLDAVFDKFKGYLDSKLEDFASTQSGLIPKNVDADRNTRKLQREAEARKLKKKGNNKQFLFNAEILDELDELDVITEELHSEDTDSALKTTKRVGKFIQKRQKLIKLADKSEAGWLAVDEYESDELADDSADEKRIKKAQEKAAGKKKDHAKPVTAVTPSSTFSRGFQKSRRQDDLLFRGLQFLTLYLIVFLCEMQVEQRLIQPTI